MVNVIGQFDSAGCCRVTNEINYIVVNPDTLLSGTSVVSSLHCTRRSVVFVAISVFLDIPELLKLIMSFVIFLVKVKCVCT